MCIHQQVSFLLKFYSVVPIPKEASDLSQPSSYRSIGLFPIAGKIFEPLINTIGGLLIFLNLSILCLTCNMAFAIRFPLLRSTSLNTLPVVDRQGESRSVAVDISKALGKSWHQGLHKLLSHGITGPLHQLLASFLKGRQMSVVLDGQKSSTKHINTGVSQGSILRLTLFLIFIKDLSLIFQRSWHCQQVDDVRRRHHSVQFH